MVRVCCGSVSHNLCQNIGAPCFGMFQLFQDDDSRSLAHHKSVSLFIKRNGAAVWFIVGGKSGQCRETTQAKGSNRSLCTSGRHHIHLSTLDTAVSLSNTIGSCCTGGHHVDILSAQSQLNRHIPGRHVGNHQRHH